MTPDPAQNAARPERQQDPRHPTKLPRIKEALDVFGKRLVVSVEEAA
jgi:hypothetical protein